MMKKFLLLTSCFLLLTSCSNSKLPSSSSENDTYQIGVIMPMSGSAALYGYDVQKGLKVMADEINAEGGVHGKPIEFIWEDGKCNPGEATKAAQKLINIDKVKLLMGMPCSGETLGVAPIAEKNKVVLVTTLAKAPKISQAGDYVFRFSTPASTHGKLIGDHYTAAGKTMGSITEQTDFPLGVLDAVRENFKNEHHEEFFLSTESDFKTLLTKLKNKDVDVLFINPQAYDKMAIMLRQIQELQWDDVEIAMNETAANGSGELQKEYADMLKERNTISAVFVIPDRPSVKAYLEKYRERFEKEPDYTEAYLMSLDGMRVVANILNDIPDPYDTDAIRDGLYDVEDYEGIQGKFSLDENGDITLTQKLVQFDGEAFSVVE